MNLRQLPAVKNKIKYMTTVVLMCLGLALFLLLIIIFDPTPISFYEYKRWTWTLMFGAPVLFIMGFYNLYDLLKFNGSLKRIETQDCIILKGKGRLTRRGWGRNTVYLLEVDVINSDGAKKTYESGYFNGKLCSQAAAVLGGALFFKEKISKDFFNKVLEEDFTVYVDIKNPKNYFVDISPLYIAAEQK